MTDSNVDEKPDHEDEFAYKQADDHLKIQVKLTNSVEFLAEGPCTEVQSAYDKFTASGERRRGVTDRDYE